MTKKYVSQIIKQRNIIHGLQKLAEDPEQRVVRDITEWGKFSNDIKDQDKKLIVHTSKSLSRFMEEHKLPIDYLCRKCNQTYSNTE